MKSIFVFGSNLAGRHGKGAALFAAKNHGAKYGVGCGPTGNSYAIPTKDFWLRPIGLLGIRGFVYMFLAYARARPELIFVVTRIGCGLAGYKDEEIAPMFEAASSNCLMPPEWQPYLVGASFHSETA